MTYNEPLTSASTTIHRRLAERILNTVPEWGTWARSLGESDTPYGRISYRQSTLLRAIHRMKDPQTQATIGNLSTLLAVQASVVSRAADKLEEAGLIVRVPSSSDGRQFLLHLTPRGVQAFLWMRQHYASMFLKEIEQLDDNAVQELDNALVHLENILHALRNEQTGNVQ